ncbi:MAG: hypothetical protein WC916_04940 [Candidatus Woesearchaeota archaeon]
MDLEQFLEEDIITFLDSKVETRGTASVDREDDYGLYITKDYVKELETALQNDNLSRAKKLFDELKAIYHTYNQPLGKKKIYIMLDEMYTRITKYVEEVQERRVQVHLQGVSTISALGRESRVPAFAMSQEQPIIIIKNAIIENLSEKKNAMNALPKEIAAHPANEQNQQKIVAQEKIVAKKDAGKSVPTPLFIATPKTTNAPAPQTKEILDKEYPPIPEKQEHAVTPLFKSPPIPGAPSLPRMQNSSPELTKHNLLTKHGLHEHATPQKQPLKQSSLPIATSAITKTAAPPHSTTISQQKSLSPKINVQEIHQLYSSGLRELYHQRFSEAQAFFEEIIARDPNNRAARIRKEQCQEASIHE